MSRNLTYFHYEMLLQYEPNKLIIPHIAYQKGILIDHETCLPTTMNFLFLYANV